MIKQLFTSKKAWAAFAAVAVTIINQLFGLGLDVNEVVVAIIPAIVYIIGQGIADNGKEAARVNGDTMTRAAAIQRELNRMLNEYAKRPSGNARQIENKIPDIPVG